MPKTAADALSSQEADQLFSALAGHSLLVGVSGGPDSVALMGLLAQWAVNHSAKITVATVDHGLRPESRVEAEQVANLAQQLGLPHKILHWDEAKPENGLPQAARDARYSLLTAYAAEIGTKILLTAHTLDDQAETILYRLLRGSGPLGLIAMQNETVKGNVRLVRPLLNVVKSRLIATCRVHHWPFITDPSNQNDKFTRARLRKIMPLLAREGLVPERLITLGQRMLKLEQVIAPQIEALWHAALLEKASTQITFDAGELKEAQTLLLERLLQKSMSILQGNQHLRLDRLEALTANLQAAFHEMRAFRRTLGSCLISFNGNSTLNISLAPPRRSKSSEITITTLP